MLLPADTMDFKFTIAVSQCHAAFDRGRKTRGKFDPLRGIKLLLEVFAFGFYRYDSRFTRDNLGESRFGIFL